MNVLFITHNYPRYQGDYSGVFLHTLARRLADEGISVTVVAPHDKGAEESEIVDGIQVHRIRYAPEDRETFAYRGNMHRQLLTPAGPLRFQRFIKKFSRGAAEIALRSNFDLIAAHWAIPGARIGGLVANAARTPLVVHSHGTDVRLLSKIALARWFSARALRQARRWTVVSSFLAELAKRAFPKLTDKIEICPLPNDETMFYRDESIVREPKLLVAVTRFTQQKRPETLIKACAILKDRGADFSLEVYAAGPLKEQIQEQIAGLGLGDCVTLCKPVSQERLRAVYNRAQIIVLNSLEEGFGLTLVEGALCGALPVGVSSGGITDIITHKQTGLLAKADSAEALADALQQALEDRDQTARLAQAARENALKRFTGHAVAQRFAEIYRAALGS